MKTRNEYILQQLIVIMAFDEQEFEATIEKGIEFQICASNLEVEHLI